MPDETEFISTGVNGTYIPTQNADHTQTIMALEWGLNVGLAVVMLIAAVFVP